jgi:gliding motility-associated-like protein
MKKILLSVLLIILFHTSSMATHLIGGEMRYEYIGPGIAPNSKQYRIRLYLFKGSSIAGAPFISRYIVGVFNNDNSQKIPGPDLNNNWAAVEEFAGTLNVPINISPCILSPPILNYTYKIYSFVIELPNNNAGYTIAFQTFSRQNSQNILNGQGANYLCVIPGLNTIPVPQIDNSPAFKLPVSVVCENSNFVLDFSATDTNGDSLAYRFCNAYDGGLATLADFTDPVPPPYQSVNYLSPFTGITPLGPLASINGQTGIISGIAPAAGKYVVCVCIAVYRNGVLIGSHRKDLFVEVSACIPTEAIAMPSLTTCDGFNIQFDHTSTGANSVFWDFGDPTTLADTSTLDNPVYVYSDTGLYIIKFIINKGGNCTDSTTRTVGVYPGFFPGFNAAAPFCTGVPIQFNDTSNTNYGSINSWSWNFGNLTTLADTSHLQNPQYTFTSPGTYNTQFIVSNSKGCRDTLFKDVTVLSSPNLNLLSPDSAYCGLDSLQLSATGLGNFSWTPVTNILGANTATPTVFPSVPTTYTVTLENMGCRSSDTVRLTPLFDLTNNINALPATICQEDTLTLTGSSNKSSGLSWSWSPAATIATPASQTTLAWPASTTTYSLQTRWGNHCVVSKTITIPVTPLAIPNAGPDTSFCSGQTAIQLSASGGNSYNWSPAAGLSSTTIANPTASPAISTNYIVSVGVNGCSKKRTDTIIVIVRMKPVITLTNDTLICVPDTLQLNVNGPGMVQWSPNYMISNTTSFTPLVSPDLPTLYRVRYTDLFGCFNDDSVFVDVKAQVTLDAGNDTSICRTEGYTLHTTGDAVTYTWVPTQFLSNPNIKNPFANPPNTTTYTVIGNIGKCQAQSDISIKVAPYPIAKAGKDTAICIGYNVQLNATGGSSYSWSPIRFLSNPLIANPIVQHPTADIQYIVTVTDTLGCSKGIKDTLFVIVIPALHVDAGPSDTSIVEDEPLYLQGSGALTYTWFPATWLSNPLIPNPVAQPKDSIKYILTGRDVNGCLGSDSIRVRIFKVDPDMYVPTAFTPNGDGQNDLTRPILLGMKSLTYFRVYNRFGELMFSTSKIEDGWNGIYKGKPQDPATFVWMAEGITFKGQVKRKKGYVVLIR